MALTPMTSTRKGADMGNNAPPTPAWPPLDRIAPKADTLATLDLNEKPGQRITWICHVPHSSQDDQRVDVQPGEHVFSCGHHSAYAYTVAQTALLTAPQTKQGKVTRWAP